MKDLNIAFFGTPQFAVDVLDELEACNVVPSLVITAPDKPRGRKLVLTPPEVKVWAEGRNIEVFQPETLKTKEAQEKLKEKEWDLFIVASYGLIIPKDVLDTTKHGVLNVHPSMLPLYRGASPIRSAILNDDRDAIGVSIMLLDEKLDHGPIIAQEYMEISDEKWPIRGLELDKALAKLGGSLLASIIPDWIEGNIDPQEQDHSAATFCGKITKDMGKINLEDDPYQNLLKIRAFDGWPGTYFFKEKNGKKIRVKITDAELASDGSLQILRVIPEGKNEMSYEEFLR